MNQSNQAKVTVECGELETLKQQAMEMALRIHVLQGGNLLDELTPAPAQSATKRKWRAMDRREKIILAAFIATVIICLIGVFSLKQPVFFWVLWTTIIANGIYINRKNKRKGVAS